MINNYASSEAGKLMMFEARKKSVTLAYIIWFFLSIFGGHRFYAGRVKTGVGMIALFFISLILGFIPFIGGICFFILLIWVVVDGFVLHSWIKEHNIRLAAELS
ncbi:MAG: TM2 domain-containing protein [Rhodospirillales bacterium]|nr:TM2 domain-containing protein [Rhodospirillales bacterium]